MDQFDRGSRMRLGEETVRQRLARADGERDRRRSAQIGYPDDDHVGRYLLLTLIAAIAITALIVGASACSDDSVGDSARGDGAHVGTPTQEFTRVRPPGWLTLTAPSPEEVVP